MPNITKLIATFFGLGYIPTAPGTFGALGGLLISFGLMHSIIDYNSFQYIHIFLIAVSFLAGSYACHKLKAEWGHDPSKVVIDETLGFWISILFLPVNLYIFFVAFVLFRIFDIAKPFGIKKIDQSHKSYSVMLDDVVAGVYSNISLQIIVYLLDFDQP